MAVNDDDFHLRELWREGSLCKIYSRSKHRWYEGRIIKIFDDEEGEWLKVRYNGCHCKHIQRLCRDLKVIKPKLNTNRIQIKQLIIPKNHMNCINYKNMSLNKYIDTKKCYDEMLIYGYLRLKTIHLIPSVIFHLICKWYHKQTDIFEFDLKDTLGTGTFGTVRLAQHKKTGKQYAIKMLNKEQIIEMKQENHIKNEREILNEIRNKNPFIISMLLSFEDLNCIYLIFELLPMGFEFFDLLKTYDRLNITQCVFYSSQIVLIFEYLHQNHIIYRDLKPENLMYTNDGYLKLIDFGFSKKVDKTTFTLCGTPDYLSPEMILNKGHSFGVDWWALGILIFEMYLGFTPFQHDNVIQIYTKIINYNQNNQHQILKYMNDNQNLCDIVSKLLCKNTKNRLGANSCNGDINDIKSHPFFKMIDWNKIYHKQYTNTPKHSPIYQSYHSHPIKNNVDVHSQQKPLNLTDF